MYFVLLCYFMLYCFLLSDYATDSCGHVHGPDHLTVIEFDKDVDYIKNKPSTEQNFLPPLHLRYHSTKKT